MEDEEEEEEEGALVRKVAAETVMAITLSCRMRLGLNLMFFSNSLIFY